MAVIAALLVFGSLVVAFFGFMLASQATAGVAVISVAILMAVLARIAQAADHHKEAMLRAKAAPEATTAKSSSDQ